jgi:FkbM family methyltransferase
MQQLIVLKIIFKKTLRRLLAIFNLNITSNKNLTALELYRASRSREDLDLLLLLKSDRSSKIMENFRQSKSQLRQDLFVLSELNFKRKGFFVEFGAANGVDLSNTFLLERSFGWSGILAEPARIWSEQLTNNRPNSSIEKLCVWKDSNSILIFNETNIPEISTIDSFNNNDSYVNLRKNGRKYEVKTISLNDLLKKYSAPNLIDYLSIDTEGSEFEILNAFDFDTYSIKIITCEHNYSDNREKIFKLLTSKGYKRKYVEVSDFEDWYVLTS